MTINLKSALHIFILPAFILLCLGTFAHAQSPNDGQAAVTDQDVGTDGKGVLFIVDLRNGNRTVVSDFGDPSQGPLGDDPQGIALSEDLKNAYVVDEEGTGTRGALFHVNLRTGQRIIISDFEDPEQGPLGDEPYGIATEGETAYVVDRNEGTDNDGLLFRIDLNTGDRTIISDFGDLAQGPLGSNPTDLILDGAGGAYVTDEDGPDSNGRGTLFHVDLTTGNRTIVSNFGDFSQGPIGANPFGIAMSSPGYVFVTDEDSAGGALFEVNVTTGDRILLSAFNNPEQGPTGSEPQGVTTNFLGQALVVDRNGGADNNGTLVLIDTSTGVRTTISDFDNPAQGPLGEDPLGIAYISPVRNVPTLSEWGVIAMAGVLGIVGFMVLRRKKAAA